MATLTFSIFDHKLTPTGRSFQLPGVLGECTRGPSDALRLAVFLQAHALWMIERGSFPYCREAHVFEIDEDNEILNMVSPNEVYHMACNSRHPLHFGIVRWPKRDSRDPSETERKHTVRTIQEIVKYGAKELVSIIILNGKLDTSTVHPELLESKAWFGDGVMDFALEHFKEVMDSFLHYWAMKHPELDNPPWLYERILSSRTRLATVTEGFIRHVKSGVGRMSKTERSVTLECLHLLAKALKLCELLLQTDGDYGKVSLGVCTGNTDWPVDDRKKRQKLK